MSEKSYTVVSSGVRVDTDSYDKYWIWDRRDEDGYIVDAARTSCDLADANRRVARLEGALQGIATGGIAAHLVSTVAKLALAPLEGEEEKPNDKTTS